MSVITASRGAEAELKQRLEAFALELHPDKTRMIEFGRFALENRRARGQGKPETFAFLGLTHIFGRTREGRRLIRRHTVRERLNAKLRQVTWILGPFALPSARCSRQFFAIGSPISGH